MKILSIVAILIINCICQELDWPRCYIIEPDVMKGKKVINEVLHGLVTNENDQYTIASQILFSYNEIDPGVRAHKINYLYNPSGAMESYELYDSLNQDWVLNWKCKFFYDDSNSIRQEFKCCRCAFGKGKCFTEKVIIEKYTDSKVIIETTNIFYYNGGTVPSSINIKTFTYNSNGFLKETESRTDTVRSITKYFYYNDNKVSGVERRLLKGDSIAHAWNHRYKYEDGLLTTAYELL